MSMKKAIYYPMKKIEEIAVIEKGKALGNPTGRFVQIGENPFAGLYTDVFFMGLEETLELNFATDIYDRWPSPSYYDALFELLRYSGDTDTKNIEVIEHSSNIEVIVSSELVEDKWGGEDEYLDFTISITSLSGGLGSIKLRITNIYDKNAEIEFKVMVTDNRVSIGDTIYENLSQTVESANNSDIIKLMNDIGGDYMSVGTGEWQLVHTYANNESWDDVQGLYIKNVYNMINHKSLILDLNGKAILTNSLKITDTNLTIIDSVGGMITGAIQFECSGNIKVDHYVTSGSNYGRVIDYNNPNTICLAGGSYLAVAISDYVEVIIDGASIINTGELGYYNAVSGNATAATLIVKSGILGTEESDTDINIGGIGIRAMLMGKR